MYIQFSGMNFGIHGCGIGGEPVESGVTILVVLVMGGSLSSSSNNCVDVYPPCVVTDEYGGFTAGRMEPKLDEVYVLCPWWGLGVPSGTSSRLSRA